MSLKLQSYVNYIPNTLQRNARNYGGDEGPDEKINEYYLFGRIIYFVGRISTLFG